MRGTTPAHQPHGRCACSSSGDPGRLKVDLVLNLRSAQHVGITIPPTMLLRAERVIE